ncbi:MAG: ATP-binding protein [Bacillota bacterium]|nr:ATP-binding protein [Bacillota bacterium]
MTEPVPGSRWTFRLRVGLAIAGVAFVALLVAAWWGEAALHRGFQRYLTEATQERADEIALRLAQAYRREGGWPPLLQDLEAGGRGRGLRLFGLDSPAPGAPAGRGRAAPLASRLLGSAWALTDARGRLLYATAAFDRELLRDSAGTLIRAPVEAGGRRVGTVWLAPPRLSWVQTLEGEFQATATRQVFLGSLVALLLAALAAALLSRWLSAPLRQLLLTVRRLAQGDLGARAPAAVSSQGDEFGELARALDGLAVRLEESEAGRRRLMADVAHELRTPLAVLQGHLEAIHEAGEPPRPETILSLEDEVLRMSRLVRELQEVSLAEAHALELRPQRLPVAPLVAHMLELYQAEADSRGVRLEGSAAGELAVRADRDRLVQVLSNLLANALRHCPAGGSVTLSAEPAPAGDGGGVLFHVTDTGPGIPARDLPLVFERFWRGDPARSRETGGSGLGLAIVRSFVQAQGGRVDVESPWPPGARGGTRFSVWLPAA